MGMETLRICGQTLREFDQLLARDTSVLLVLGFIAAAEIAVPVLWKIAHQRFLGDLHRALLCGLVLALDRPYALRDMVSVNTDLPGVNLIQRRMLLDRLIHQRVLHPCLVPLALTV